MGLTLLTAPAEEPLTLADAKAHLRVDVTDDDALITALITAAREQAEHRTGRALVTQQWQITLHGWPCHTVIQLPKPPLASVEEVSYLDSDGARQVIPDTDYQVITDTLLGQVLPAYGLSWPSYRDQPGSVQVNYTAGYGDAADVPQSIKAWMLLAIGAWYARREALAIGSVMELPRAFWDALLDPYTIPSL